MYVCHEKISLTQEELSPFIGIPNLTKMDHNLKNQVFWDVTLCRWANRSRRFKTSQRLQLLGQSVLEEQQSPAKPL